jgi:SAM-dependent methyltransferase
MGPALRARRLTNEPLYADLEFARLYDWDCPWPPDSAYCLTLARNAASVLDLGSGTGRFCTRLAEFGPRVIFGVDPGRGMMTVARARPLADRVTFSDGSAQTVRLGRRFDLIVMMGHAFQTLLTNADRAAAFATIAAHLTPRGRFIFDSRNPAAREWERWTPDRRHDFDVPGIGPVTSWTVGIHDEDTGIVAYAAHYNLHASGRRLETTSRIAFPPRDQLDAEMAAAGLRVLDWLGEWDGRPFTPDAPEIIPFGQLA